jgi:hypothetical protein
VLPVAAFIPPASFSPQELRIKMRLQPIVTKLLRIMVVALVPVKIHNNLYKHKQTLRTDFTPVPVKNSTL